MSISIGDRVRVKSHNASRVNEFGIVARSIHRLDGLRAFDDGTIDVLFDDGHQWGFFERELEVVRKADQ